MTAQTNLHIEINFADPTFLYRLKQANRRTEFIIRAMGHNDRANTHIIDATAGLGQDSLLLAANGYQVTMIERSPTVYALLKDALAKAKDHPILASVIQRVNLIHNDAVTYLSQQVRVTTDIIYLDPMFPPKQKNAASKKTMQTLQLLLSDELDNTGDLFAMALTCAKKRVVVKRPRLAQAITQAKPSFSIIGNSSRFDIYVNATNTRYE